MIVDRRARRIRREPPSADLSGVIGGKERLVLDQRHQPAAQALEPPRKLKFEQHGPHDGG